MLDWTDEVLQDRAAAWLVEGWTYQRIATTLGVSRCAVAGAIWRWGLRLPKHERAAHRRLTMAASRELFRLRYGESRVGRWSDDRLTERWADRKARRHG